jgi:hypothetical protein
MDIADKQRLWSKYYLINTDRHTVFSLASFALKEAKTFNLGKKDLKLKRNKIIRYMLKAIPKNIIISRYLSGSREAFKKSKNDAIEAVITRLR